MPNMFYPPTSLSGELTPEIKTRLVGAIREAYYREVERGCIIRWPQDLLDTVLPLAVEVIWNELVACIRLRSQCDA